MSTRKSDPIKKITKAAGETRTGSSWTWANARRQARPTVFHLHDPESGPCRAGQDHGRPITGDAGQAHQDDRAEGNHEVARRSEEPPPKHLAQLRGQSPSSSMIASVISISRNSPRLTWTSS